MNKPLSKLTSIIESIIFVSGNAVPIKDIAEKLEISEKDVLNAAKEIQKKYSGDCGLQLLMFNKKLQFASNPDNADEVAAVLNPIKEKELSRSLLETAAIIAYRQPVTRADLEALRGNSEYAVQKLLELKMIEPIGRKDAVGRPLLFATTDEFLKRFQISSLDELPDYDELLNQIRLIHVRDDASGYLYQKGEYSENEVAVTEDTERQGVAEPEKTNQEENTDDFDLPDIEDEELPEYLQGEDVDVIK